MFDSVLFWNLDFNTVLTIKTDEEGSEVRQYLLVGSQPVCSSNFVLID